MKRLIFATGMGLVCLLLYMPQLEAQSFIKKIKKKTEDAAIDKMFEPVDNSETQPKSVYTSESTTSMENTKGGGLDTEAPDVMNNIESAEKSFNKKDFGDARYAVRQAILGVELEIGKNILEGLPSSISGIPKVESEDQVTSSGIGFVGLIIQRVYRSKDQEMRVTVGNDAAMLSAVNMYLASGAYASSNQEQNVKQTKYKDYPAIIEFDDQSGYQLSVPFGQSSVFVTNGINYNTESEFMSASEEVDLEDIKTKLGEK